ncbi:hypothetical protein NEHOM01_1014 [Nematocida homosporus]|uniref:uncharacterized protein n=1 Tax=Nematocida homosporus TaxID=1912981 RepID=UPI00221F41B7|nr:uncharacterized protein NEHOM01_1014 [Nematocida homosporus]KAI5185722.1 hypothetical protein NEHOM01_1014 [Nematocida homosporus]
MKYWKHFKSMLKKIGVLSVVVEKQKLAHGKPRCSSRLSLESLDNLEYIEASTKKEDHLAGLSGSDRPVGALWADDTPISIVFQRIEQAFYTDAERIECFKKHASPDIIKWWIGLCIKPSSWESFKTWLTEDLDSLQEIRAKQKADLKPEDSNQGFAERQRYL